MATTGLVSTKVIQLLQRELMKIYTSLITQEIIKICYLVAVLVFWAFCERNFGRLTISQSKNNQKHNIETLCVSFLPFYKLKF